MVATRLIVGAATVAAAIAILIGSSGHSSAGSPHHPFHFDPPPKTISRLAAGPPMPVAVIKAPAPSASLAYGYGALWSLSGTDVMRIQPKWMRKSLFRVVGRPCENRQIATGLGGIWFVSGNCSEPGTLTEVSPGSGRVVWRVRMPALLGGVAASSRTGTLLVTALNGSAQYPAFTVSPGMHRVIALRGTVAGPVGAGGGSSGLATVIDTPSGFWADSGGYGGVVSVVPHPPRVTARVYYVNLQDTSIAYGGGSLWAALGNQVLQLDAATGDETGPQLEPSSGITAVAYGDAAVWIATSTGNLYRYAPGDSSLQLAAHLPRPATSLVAGGGYVWAGSVSSNLIERVGPLPPV